MAEAPAIDRTDLEREKLRLEKEILEEEISLEERRVPVPEATSANQAGGYKSSSRGRGLPISPGTAIDLTLEAGIPMVGQALATPLTPAVQAGVGSITSILGTILAETRRVVMGEQERYMPGRVVQAGLTGAVPFAGPAKTANRLMQSAKNIGVNATRQAAGGLAGSAAQNFIDEGDLPSGSEALITTALPAIMGAGGSAFAEYGAKKALRSRRILENAAIFGAADVTPTPGMLLPEELASIEQKLARDRRGGVEASRIDQTRQQMIDKLNGAGGGTVVEGATIFADLKPLLGQITTAEDEIAKLSTKAIAARKVAGEKFRALREAEKAQTADVNTEVRKAAETAMNVEYDANLESILDNARQIVTERMAGRRVSGLDPATFRDLQVEHVALPLRAAFKERADQMYSLVDNTIKGFDAAPILAEAEAITKTASGRLPTDLQRGVDDLRALLQTADEGMSVSLQDLRRARDQLLSRVDTGVPISSDEQRLITGITKKISSEIEAQAPKVFGADGAKALKDANAYYANVRPLFDKPGVKVLFSNDPADEYVGKVLRGIQTSGTNSDEYRNVMTLVDEVRKTHPEQAGAIEDLFKNNLKESILFRARGKNLNPATGEYEVDAKELIKTLEPMGNTPGTLETLGLGNKEQLAEMKRLFSDYPDASKLSDVQWEALLASPAFAKAATGRELAPILKPFLAASAADTKLVRSVAEWKAGKVAASRRTYEEARDTLRTANGDLAALQTKRDFLLRDPVAVALDNPNLPREGYDGFARAFFDPSPSKVTNDDLAGVVAAMEKGPRPVRETLNRLRERYIADRIAVFKPGLESSKMAQELDTGKIRRFFEPTSPGDPASELARAQTLLTKEQLNRLDDLAGVIRSVDLYERFGPGLTKPGSAELPFVGQPRRIVDAVVDLFRARKYDQMAQVVLNPEKFARQQRISGDRMIQGGGVVQQAGQGAARVLSR